MKIEFFKLYENGNKKQCIGNRHKLELSNGEKFLVVTDKEKDKTCGEWWNVTDIETGIAIVGIHEHLLFIYPFENSNETEKGALKLAKARLEEIIKSGKTFKQLKESKLKEAKESLKCS